MSLDLELSQYDDMVVQLKRSMGRYYSEATIDSGDGYINSGGLLLTEEPSKPGFDDPEFL